MIAEAVAGSQDAFVVRMNEAAQHLGMTRTHFANVNGLPDALASCLFSVMTTSALREASLHLYRKLMKAPPLLSRIYIGQFPHLRRAHGRRGIVGQPPMEVPRGPERIV